MANPEHLKKLKEGMKAWNQWREENSGVRVNLYLANLRGADLSMTYLGWVDLHMADLSGANLHRANLSGSDLGGANLSGADLSGANLYGADLDGANLGEADLSGANLAGANLSGANLGEANLHNAITFNSIFSDIDLSNVIGLEKVNHAGPSSIGIDTIKRSAGKLPEVFLQGCGLSPWEIEISHLYNPDLKPSDVDEILATKIYQKRVDGALYIGGVFISYSHNDSSFVDKLYKELQDAGVSVWLDRHDMLAGDINKQVVRQIRIKDIVVVVLSKESIESDWVEMELEEARAKEKIEKRDVLCPVAVDDCWKSLEGPLWRKLKRTKNILDFSAWKTKKFKGQFDKLIKGMQLNY